MSQTDKIEDYYVFIEEMIMHCDLKYSVIAEKCGVSEVTVRNWISQREIPIRFLHCMTDIIKGLKESTVTCVEKNGERSFNVELSLTDYLKLSEKAVESGCSVGELISKRLESLSKS